MTPLEKVVGALEAAGSRRNGRDWQCPAHEDQRASLSAKEGRDGAAVLHCHAGCRTEDVLLALGLEWTDLFPDGDRKQAKPEIVATYDYTDEAGELLYQGVRYFPKDFRRRRPDGNGGWIWSLKDADDKLVVRMVPYRLPKVLEQARAGGMVFVVEGEKDVAALERAGVVATTNLGGADAPWLPEYTKALEGCTSVIVVADRDDAGRRHAHKIVKSLEAARIPVELVEAKGGLKDAADHLAAGHGPFDFPPADISGTVPDGPAREQAPAAQPDTGGLLAGIRNGAWLDAQEFPPLVYAVPGVIPEGLVLMVGAPKIGKSWKVLASGLAVSSGGVALGAINVGPARPVFYLALEDGDRRLQDRCRRLLGPDPIPERLDYITRVMPGQVVATITAWLERHAGEQPFVVLDTLGKVMPQALPGESSYQRDYRVGSMLKQLADEHPGSTLLVNHHDRKAAAEDFIDSVSGTHGLAGAADTIVVLDRDRNEAAGLLKVTGRDVPEGEYAVVFEDGYRWRLDGEDLVAAAQHAQQARATAGLGDRSAEVVRYVGEHSQGVTPTDVAAALDMDPAVARTYLVRAVQAGRLSRPHRGLYTPVATVASVAFAEADQPESNTRNTSNTPAGGVDAS